MSTDTRPRQETWSLTELFENEAVFQRAKAELEAALPGLDRLRGRLGQTARDLADALDESTELYKAFYRLRCYAALRSDEDTRDAHGQGLRQGVEFVGTQLSSRLAFVRPEILSIPPETIEKFLAEEPRLAPHAFYLRDLNRQRAHVLGPAEERIMAESGMMVQSPPSLYNVLHNAELPRPEVELRDGRSVRLVPVEFHKQRASQNREDRITVFSAYFGAYRAFNETLGQNLHASLKSHLFRSRARGYESCVAAALDRDNVPVQVYRNLIRQVRDRLPLLHRYLELRRRALGLERLEYPDLYCPLIEAPPRRYSPREARALVAESLAPLGGEYVAALRDAFGQRWIDWHPAEGKRAGAYSTGWAYDVHPYVLLNYDDAYEGVSTLAHEIGHAMHSFFSNRAQPFATADYSIFVAEVASTLNESLLSARALELAESPEERLFVLASHLDGLRGTLFRQTMFAEFELAIHERAERGEVLTGPRLNEIYLELLRAYHGHDEGVMHVADEFAVEWAAIPHFYYDFYVYQYATGVIAATALSEELLRDGAGARSRYREFLAAGGSDYPLELLRRGGVDLESEAPYALAFEALERYLDRLTAQIETSATSRQSR